MKILVTGAKGFIGKNLVFGLQGRDGIDVIEYDLDSPTGLLDEGLKTADAIFHLAGVNRPERPEEFREGNTNLTRRVCDALRRMNRKPLLILSSSTQAALDNPYGISKREAEETVFAFAAETGSPVAVFRLPGVFGKWCRPNYNSVVATFCYNIAHDLPITISDPARELELVYVDDVVEAFQEEIRGQRSEDRDQNSEGGYRTVKPSYRVTLGRLAELIRSFREMRRNLILPDFRDAFTHKLYGTFLSYLAPGDFAYDLTKHTDPRGCLSEFLKSDSSGQIFVSRTKPGITRGNHYHHTKTEKFLVVQGNAVIRFRDVRTEGGEQRTEVRDQRTEDRGQRTEVRDQRTEVRGQRTEDRGQRSEIIEYRVSGEDFRVVDIPPGYTHSIENVGQEELVTIFWADQIFNPEKADTVFEEV